MSGDIFWTSVEVGTQRLTHMFVLLPAINEIKTFQVDVFSHVHGEE